MLGLSVLDLGPMYATEVRCASSLNAPYPRGGGIIIISDSRFASWSKSFLQGKDQTGRKNDMESLGLSQKDVQSRNKWRRRIKGANG